ncbi:MAG: hypothetical protein C4K47_05285 [Candidatus Thorarchaeota archaeon]|nr:MAG: hypothetical protein C4K47_05285 [Candidatus Thorarchaeota archaeon]
MEVEFSVDQFAPAEIRASAHTHPREVALGESDAPPALGEECLGLLLSDSGADIVRDIAWYRYLQLLTYLCPEARAGSSSASLFSVRAQDE